MDLWGNLSRIELPLRHFLHGARLTFQNFREQLLQAALEQKRKEQCWAYGHTVLTDGKTKHTSSSISMHDAQNAVAGKHRPFLTLRKRACENINGPDSPNGLGGSWRIICEVPKPIV